MLKKFYFLLFFLSTITFSQGLEDRIYKDLDVFTADKNAISLQELGEKENYYQTKIITEKEYLALVILQCNKAYFLKENQQIKQAILTYENAWENFSDKKLSNYDIIEFCLKPLGNLYIKIKDYTNAENTIKQYIFLAEKKGDAQQKNGGLINLCVLYQKIGKHQLVLSIVEEAMQTIDNAAQKEILKTLKSISLIALENYTEKTTNVSLKYQLAIQNKEYEKAFHFFKKFQKENVKKQFSVREKAKILFEEAQLLYLLNKQEVSKKRLQEALQTLLPNLKESDILENEMLYAENTFIDIFDLNARLKNTLEEKLKNYDFSFYVASLLANEITSQEAKIISESENRKRSETCIELLFEAYKITSKNKFIEMALFYAEKNKSSLLNKQFQKKILLKKYASDTLLLKEKVLFNKQAVLTNLLIKEQVLEENSTKICSLSKQLTATSIALKRIKVVVREKYKSQGSEPFSFLKIKEKLEEDNATLVEYFYGDSAIYQFIISKNAIEFYQLKNTEEIKKEIINYIRFFDNSSVINNNVNAFKEKSFIVYKLLNLHKTINTKNVIVIPDGLFYFLPFETLLTATTLSNDFSSMPFLVKNKTIVYRTSLHLFTNKTKSRVQKKVLGFFPIYAATNKELRYSLQEAKYIDDQISSTLLMNKEATKSRFIEQAPNYAILHLSTHGTAGSFTTPASISFYDDDININELYSLDLDTDLVVLSACDTGVGKLQKGEGVMSLARGFKYAGVKNVLFSLWKINDKSTSEIMHYFYSNLNSLSSISYANNASKIKYLSDTNISNAKKSPYYWGAFVYYGSLEKPISKSKLYLYGVVFLIVISLTFKFREKILLFFNSKKNRNDR